MCRTNPPFSSYCRTADTSRSTFLAVPRRPEVIPGGGPQRGPGAGVGGARRGGPGGAPLPHNARQVGLLQSHFI